MAPHKCTYKSVNINRRDTGVGSRGSIVQFFFVFCLMDGAGTAMGSYMGSVPGERQGVVLFLVHTSFTIYIHAIYTYEYHTLYRYQIKQVKSLD